MTRIICGMAGDNRKAAIEKKMTDYCGKIAKTSLGKGMQIPALYKTTTNKNERTAGNGNSSQQQEARIGHGQQAGSKSNIDRIEV